MTFSDIADRIGIAGYPEAMNQVYESVKNDIQPACDLTLIDGLQREYNPFGEYFDLVFQTAEAVNADTDRSAWVKTAVAYARNNTVEEAKNIPVPPSMDSDLDAFLPLYVLIGMIPDSIAEYKKRGFPKEEIDHLMFSYLNSLRIVHEQTGRPGINDIYYAWQSLFAKATIYETDGLQFQLYNLPEGAVYLKNRESGDVVAVLSEGLFHASGMQLVDSKGYEDDEGAFFVSFEEDEQNYYGHRSLTAKADKEKCVFPKALWSIYAKPGDDCLSIHIPKKADISPATLNKAFASAKRILNERFPEHKSAMIYATSWVLDPILDEILKESSNIIQLAHRFVRYPQKSDGMHVFGFIFPKQFESYETLPENSSLERGLKGIYLSGRYVYFYHGIIPE